MIRILIVAAYTSVRAGLHVLLADAEDCAIVGEAGDSAGLERLLPETMPDVVIFDWNETDGWNIMELAGASEVGLVILGDNRNDYQMLAGSTIRSWAYLLKEADAAEILGAVRAVAAGLVVLDRSLAPLLVVESPLAQESPAAFAEAGEEVLTAREREVLQLMAQGLPNKQIAARLNISQHTVKFHVASILAKLGAASRTEAVTLGARRGYVIL